MSQNPTINDRILELMQFLELPPSAFADEIGIQRPSLTHIFKGRNKASLDVVQKIVARFPDINLLWLVNGTGNMSSSTPTILKLQSKQADNKPASQTDDLKNTLFEMSDPDPTPQVKQVPQQERHHYTQQDFLMQKLVNDPIEPIRIASSSPTLDTQTKSNKRITKILVFFDDSTFQELT